MRMSAIMQVYSACNVLHVNIATTHKHTEMFAHTYVFVYKYKYAYT